MKLFGFILTLSVLTMFNSCTGDNNSYYTNDIISDIFTVHENDWELVGVPGSIGSYYLYRIENLPLHNAYENGIVSVYMFEDFQNNYSVQIPLPHTVDEVVVISGREYLYTVQYTYDIGNDDALAVRAYIGDSRTDLFGPSTHDFRFSITQ